MPQSSSALSAYTSTPQGASTVLGAAGAGLQGAASLESALYRAQVARNNQTTANANADFATERGNQESLISQLRTRQTEGAQRAGFGAAGVDVNSGSAVRTVQDTARVGAIDAATIQQNAKRSAWGYQQQAKTFKSEADLDTAGGVMNAVGSLVGGASNFADKWSKWQQTGVTGAGG